MSNTEDIQARLEINGRYMVAKFLSVLSLQSTYIYRHENNPNLFNSLLVYLERG